MTENERYESLRHCKWVDEVIPDVPWVITQEFLDKHKIDYVTHDSLLYADASRAGKDVYEFVKSVGKFKETKRTDGISTSDIIMRILKDYNQYIMRNLARGYTCKDLGVSYVKEKRFRVNMGLKKLHEKVKEQQEKLQTAAKTAGLHHDEWMENADRWVAGFLEKLEEGCHLMVIRVWGVREEASIKMNRISLILLWLCIGSNFIHLEARTSPKARAAARKLKPVRKLVGLTVDPLVAPQLAEAPFQFSPYEDTYGTGAPISLPVDAPSFCVYPPFAPNPPSSSPYEPPPESPPGFVPGPPDYGPSPPGSPVLPNPPEYVPSPPAFLPGPPIILPSPPEFLPGPPIILPSPPAFLPGPPEYVPSPPQYVPGPVPGPPEYVPGPPEYVPSPSGYVPGPPEYVPNPPEYVPSPPEYVPGPPVYFPGPPEYVPGPPEYVPGPPEYVPSPPGYVPGPPEYVPSPPGYVPGPPEYVPGPPIYFPGPPGYFPGPPVFQPPVIYPPPAVPPPPYNPGKGLNMWCVAKPTVPDPIIQEAMNYACGSGADCDTIQPEGSCYQPDTLLSHASYAFNSYWQRTKAAGGTCDFGGTAMLITQDPSFDGCHFILF